MDGTQDSSTGFCRDCLTVAANGHSRCASCGSPRLAVHPELLSLPIAHLDCDAFYAAVEKRDRPDLRDLPVIVGGASRGVVSTACYIARIKGVRSAMPMFKALKLCPDATVIRPDMQKYAAVSRQVKAMMRDLTPSIESLSIDEAFMDLTGTTRLHGHAPAVSLAILQKNIESKIGITVSIGLSYNKFLAKVASDLSKPRGFSVIGRTEAVAFLARQPVGLIWGVGKAMRETLERDGITGIGQLQGMALADLLRRYGSIGSRLYHLARGEDRRRVSSEGETKSVSSETTFDEDIGDFKTLESILWRQCERVAKRAKAARLEGLTVTLKLKTADFRSHTRSETVDEPTCLAHRIFEIAAPLLKAACDGRKFRLLGAGISNLTQIDGPAAHASLDSRQADRDRAELAMDKIRSKFGDPAVVRGIGLKAKS